MNKILIASLYFGCFSPLRAQDVRYPEIPPALVADTQSDAGLLADAELVQPQATTGETLRMQTAQEKFAAYKLVALGPKVLVAPGLVAAMRLVHSSTEYSREWREGPGGFARVYGNVLASSTSLKTARFLTGELLHEDFRYRPSTSKNPLARTLHALAFTLVDKSDSGHNRIAFANLAGAEAGGLVGALYLPGRYGTMPHTQIRAAFGLSGIAGQNLRREFAPDLLRLRRKLRIPLTPNDGADWQPKK